MFDLLIVGGGITGVGVALEAARAGLRVALVEQNDFASGTSSGSSKLVHGGLRYLASGDWRLTRESVHERQRLMRDVPGLVTALDFMLPVYPGDRPGRLALRAALTAYDAMAGHWTSHYLRAPSFGRHMPYLRADGLKGGFVYRDALTDDVRLTLRVLTEAAARGAWVDNYVRATRFVFDGDRVAGAELHDAIEGGDFTLRARCVVNATGPWSDRLRAGIGGAARLRPLRGSHFVFPFHVLPVARAITLFHPDDGRPLFAIPWLGATLFGTTDLDHDRSMDDAPRMSARESAYLTAAARHYFSALDLRADRALASFAGVRPVVRGEPVAAASAESRESAIAVEKGLISVTGGKLTTFRVSAHAVLVHVGRALARTLKVNNNAPIIDDQPGAARRAPGYGPAYAAMARRPGDDERLGTSDYTLGELRFALAHEAVEHLDDLLLRRTRAGLLLTGGGVDQLERIGPLCREMLGWDGQRWQAEVTRYRDHWQAVHAPV